MSALVIARQQQLRAPRLLRAVRNQPRLPYVGEEGFHRVEILLRERVELVVVAFRAAECCPQPHRAGRPHPVGAVLRQVLLRLDAALGRRAVQAVVRRRHLLLHGRIRHQVARKLLPRELVERLVVAKGPQHVVAVGPHGPQIVAVESCAVGIPHRVQPVHRLHLGVARRSQQPVHHLLVGVPRLVLQKRANLFRRGRHAGQVERHPPQQRAPVGFRRWRQSLPRQPLLNESIDRVSHRSPARLHGRHRRALHRLIGPVPLILRAFRHPLPDSLLLRGGQHFVCVLRRHDLSRICSKDPLNNSAGLRVAGHDRDHTRLSLLRSLFPDIQPQPHHPRTLIRPMAPKTGIRHNRPDIPVEPHLRESGSGESRDQHRPKPQVEKT